MKYKVDAEMVDSQGESDAAYQLCGDWDGVDGLLTAFRETLEAPLWLENAEGEVELVIRIKRARCGDWSRKQIHHVMLSNGKTVILEEVEQSINVCTSERRGLIEAYLCNINAGGITVHGNSGSACWDLIRDLDEKPSTVGNYIWDDGDWGFAEEKGANDLWFDVPVDSETGMKLIALYNKAKPSIVFMNDNGAPRESITAFIESFLGQMNEIARGG
jgi:hypothetical protein